MSEKIEAAINAIESAAEFEVEIEPVNGDELQGTVFDIRPEGKKTTVLLICGEQAETAINVLTEAAIRAKGCAWCKKYKLEFEAVDKDGNTITAGDHEVLGGDCSFCPVCGRDLREAAQ